jgi:RNA polymerase sigma-70 factor (ECF subfamily)
MLQSVRQLEAYLLTGREKLLGFIRSKISDPDLAEDILQDSLLKALQSAPDLRDEEKLIAWFYRIVRHAIVDVYRKKDRTDQVMDRYEKEMTDGLSDEDDVVLCQCFRDLIPTLKPEYAEVIEKVELGTDHAEKAASQLGISRNNLNVKRHRARLQLKQRLEEVCRMCAKHGCLDCTCKAH